MFSPGRWFVFVLVAKTMAKQDRIDMYTEENPTLDYGSYQPMKLNCVGLSKNSAFALLNQVAHEYDLECDQCTCNHISNPNSINCEWCGKLTR